MKTRGPLFVVPRLTGWRPEMASSDWVCLLGFLLVDKLHDKLLQRKLHLSRVLSTLLLLAMNGGFHHVVNEDCHDQVEDAHGNEQIHQHILDHECCTVVIEQVYLKRCAVIGNAAVCEATE